MGIDQISKELATATDRRSVVRGVGAATVAGLAALVIGGRASANNAPNNDAVDRECLKRCQRHNGPNNQNRSDCHKVCRRVRP